MTTEENAEWIEDLEHDRELLLCCLNDIKITTWEPDDLIAYTPEDSHFYAQETVRMAKKALAHAEALERNLNPLYNR